MFGWGQMNRRSTPTYEPMRLGKVYTLSYNHSNRRCTWQSSTGHTLLRQPQNIKRKHKNRRWLWLAELCNSSENWWNQNSPLCEQTLNVTRIPFCVQNELIAYLITSWIHLQCIQFKITVHSTDYSKLNNLLAGCKCHNQTDSKLLGHLWHSHMLNMSSLYAGEHSFSSSKLFL